MIPDNVRRAVETELEQARSMLDVGDREKFDHMYEAEKQELFAQLANRPGIDILATVADPCEDMKILQALNEWVLASEEALIPFRPGPFLKWLDYLEDIAEGGEKFSSDLGELLRPWIPANMWGSVVKQ